jgi:outer membrane protein assembly factor BamE
MRMLSTYPVRAPALASAFSIVIVLAVCLTGCASKPPLTQNSADSNAVSAEGVQTTKGNRFLGVLTPYRLDTQQGNFVSSEIMTQLKDGMKRKEGMTRDQVRFLLGTPLINDVFHADRWDYVFRLQKANGEILTSHVSVFFKDNLLSRLDGTILPTEKDYISLIAGDKFSK